MGPNGSGKSSLANALNGNPKYEVTSGEILFEGKSILEMKPEERAKLGILMSFQYPLAIPGVTVRELLLTSLIVGVKLLKDHYGHIMFIQLNY